MKLDYLKEKKELVPTALRSTESNMQKLNTRISTFSRVSARGDTL